VLTTGSNRASRPPWTSGADAFGKDGFEIKEGAAWIFKPEGGRFALVARVQIGQWATAMM
jgi:hypothetical protein